MLTVRVVDDMHEPVTVKEMFVVTRLKVLSPANVATREVAPDGTVNVAVAIPDVLVVPEPLDEPSVKFTILPGRGMKEVAGFCSKVAETVIVEPQVPELGLIELLWIRVGIASVNAVCAMNSDVCPLAVMVYVTPASCSSI